MRDRRIGSRALTWALALGLALSGVVRADVRLPHVFGSHMVLQRDRALPVWGWADAGETVSVQLGTQPAVTATAGADGKWQVSLPPQPAGGPLTLAVKGKNTLTLEDVAIGEVWLCSGQSNMEMTVQASDNAAAEIAASADPLLRHIKVPRVPAALPQDDFDGQWTVAAPGTVGAWTAAGYFMARELRRELGVPVGLLNSSWGGTRIEPWTPPVGFEGIDTLADIRRRVALADPRTPERRERLSQYLAELDAWTAKARDAANSGALLDAAPAFPPELLSPMASSAPHGQPATLYNGMIHPLVPFAIRGAIWYQGEANHNEGMLYADKTQALVEGWRKVWEQAAPGSAGDLPFYYVQIAPFRYGEEVSYRLPQFWLAQAAALRIPNTGMVVTNDIGNVDDIHPKNKQAVGHRLALLALANTYGRKDLVWTGPRYQAMAIEGSRIQLTFDHVGSGLASRDGQPLNWFEIIGEDTDWVTAEASLDGNAVVVSSPQVAKPVAVRYAWHKNAEPNLQNREGLPAWPFMAGEVPARDDLARIPEARELALVYDLDLAKLGADFAYDVDNSAKLAGPIDRIAYFLELQRGDEPVQYVYVSMDPFTQNLAQIGIPTVKSGAMFQVRVNNLQVVSNVPGIAAGSGLPGNLEFWPHNYGPTNQAGVPGAAADVYDIGDQSGPPVDGYGSMQVHNLAARQTLFAINNWKAGANADIGIGNSEGQTRDWTFTRAGNNFKLKRLRVLVHIKR